MKKIVSQNVNDFQDVDVRRLGGWLAEAQSQINRCIEKMEELRETRPDITIQEIQQEGIFSYEFQMIPDFSKYFEPGAFG